MPRPVEKGKPRLSFAEIRAQSTLIFAERLFGKTSAEIGEKYGLATRTVERRLAQARRDGVPDEARSIFIKDMLPQSMAVLQEALTSGDLRIAVPVALKVVEGLKAMEDVAGAAASSVEETLEIWKARRVTRVVEVPDESDRPAAPLPAAVEGELADAGPSSDAPLHLRPSSVPEPPSAPSPAGSGPGHREAGIPGGSGPDRDEGGLT